MRVRDCCRFTALQDLADPTVAFNYFFTMSDRWDDTWAQRCQSGQRWRGRGIGSRRPLERICRCRLVLTELWPPVEKNAFEKMLTEIWFTTFWRQNTKAWPLNLRAAYFFRKELYLFSFPGITYLVIDILHESQILQRLCSTKKQHHFITTLT